MFTTPKEIVSYSQPTSRKGFFAAVVAIWTPIVSVLVQVMA
jgi:hypothetical protein